MPHHRRTTRKPCVRRNRPNRFPDLQGPRLRRWLTPTRFGTIDDSGLGILRSCPGGRRLALAVRCLVGRSPGADLLLQSSTVSSEHASVYFYKERWKVRDLASRNGTWVDGERLQSGEVRSLRAGSSLVFGVEGERWIIDDDSPPGPSAWSQDGKRVVAEPGGLLLLPSARAPEASVSRSGALWVMEDDAKPQRVVDGDTVTVGGRNFELELPEGRAVRSGADDHSTMNEDAPGLFELSFTLGSAEEHVKVELRASGRLVSLGARVHNYALLLLARQRMRDEQRGQTAAEAGWMYPEELAKMLHVDRKQMNLYLWRARQTLEREGLSFLNLIQRRVDAGQLRLGADRCNIIDN